MSPLYAVDVIKRLGEKCGDLSATLSGCPPLICAIMNGHTSAVKQVRQRLRSRDARSRVFLCGTRFYL